MSPEFSVLHLQYIDKFGDGFNTIAMSGDEEKALIPLMRKAIDTNEKIKCQNLRCYQNLYLKSLLNLYV